MWKLQNEIMMNPLSWTFMHIKLHKLKRKNKLMHLKLKWCMDKPKAHMDSLWPWLGKNHCNIFSNSQKGYISMVNFLKMPKWKSQHWNTKCFEYLKHHNFLKWYLNSMINIYALPKVIWKTQRCLFTMFMEQYSSCV
jgi:hypothetical protein